MGFLAEGMKNLPNKLRKLILNLENNELGENAMNLRWLAEGIK